MNQMATHRIHIGDFDCLVVKDGRTGPSPLSVMMADPPAEYATHPVTLLSGLLVVDTSEGRVLVDAGNGPHRGERVFVAEQTLAALGIEPASVNTILITHGDMDHIGGLIDGKGNLSYPNARYVLHRELWNFWHDADALNQYNPTFKELYQKILTPLLPAIESNSTIVDEKLQVFGAVGAFERITAIPAVGHRPGHTIYMIESKGEKLLHIGDAAVHPIFLEYPDKLNIRHDTDQETARDVRCMIASLAAETGASIVGSHFALPGIGTLSRISEDRNVWTPAGEQ